MIVPLSAASYMKQTSWVGVSGGCLSGAAFKYGMDDFRIVGTLGYNYGGISVELVPNMMSISLTLVNYHFM